MPFAALLIQTRLPRDASSSSLPLEQLAHACDSPGMTDFDGVAPTDVRAAHARKTIWTAACASTLRASGPVPGRGSHLFIASSEYSSVLHHGSTL